jgi:23S rRNA (cytosine1962-C5)-methyltransferase
MLPLESYQLLDFGDGRRLEQVGPLRVDRPCPAAQHTAQQEPGLWRAADARFERIAAAEGHWVAPKDLPARWTVLCGPFQLELKRTESGHLGLFAEHADNWEWIARQVQAAQGPIRVLNLFAYTGGSTLAAAAAGAEVVHVDAARNVVAWARRNAELSGLASAPIRWIVEDVRKFVRREQKRRAGYDAVILDPPSYGHGPRGEVWRLSKHLRGLLAACAALTAGRRRFLLLTCHTPEFAGPRLEGLLAEALEDSRQASDRGRISSRPMVLRTASGRELPSGVAVIWERCQ